jgi:protein-L-isoaspartate(D-aspartate) O-methyltransferase
MVYSIEIIEELAQQAKERLVHCGCTNIKLRLGNGFYGWSDAAPFDRILVTAAADLVPAPLLRQLKPGGKMVIPTGLPDAQRLVLVEKEAGGKTTMKELLRVRFALLEGAE